MRETWLLGALGLLSVLGFRYLLFAHFLPLSASAKPALLGNGASYLLAALARPRVWLLLPLLVTAFVQGGRTARTLLLALAVHALAVLLVGGDWMPGRRLFAPIVPVLALALALGLRPLLARRPRSTWSLLGLLLTLSALELAPELAAMREAGATREQNAPALAKLVCAARGPVAIVDLGLVAALCPAQSFVDLGGLTDGEVAAMRGAHLDKQIDPAWLGARAPGLVVLHSREAPRVDELGRLRWFAGYPVERRVLAAPLLRDYRVTRVLAYAPHYYYVLLAPTALPEAPAGARTAP